MSQAAFTMRELMEAGVHYGHKTKRWNPRMAPYIYGVRNNLHIINLQQTVPLLNQALQAVRQVAEKNGRVLFVGTKRQAAEPVAEAARRCGQYYVNQRWLGGMLTNWKTIQASIKRLRSLEERLAGDHAGLTKKEVLSMQRDLEKLEKSLGGIKDMGGVPDMIFVIDTTLEDLAIKEANKLNIPVVAVVDTNASLEGISYPIPGNDDATRAIKLYCELISNAVLSGLQVGLTRSDRDMGESEEVPFTEGADEGKKESKGPRGAAKGKTEKKAPAVVVKKTAAKRKADDATAEAATEEKGGDSEDAA